MPISTAVNHYDMSREQQDKTKARNARTIRLEVVTNGFVITHIDSGITKVFNEKEMSYMMNHIEIFCNMHLENMNERTY